MGNQTISPHIKNNHKYYNLIDYGYCQVWQRKEDAKQYLQQYDITIQDDQSLLKYLQMHQLRTNHPKLVNICYFSYSQRKQSFESICGSARKGLLLTQRIPIRLSQCQRVAFPEHLYILKMMLEGYKFLSQEYGLFFVNPNMVGISNEWRLKIWHHTDFSEPFPQNPHCKNNKSMIKSIIMTAEKILSYFDRKINFSEFVSSSSETQKRYLENFDLALQGFQEYIKQYEYTPVNNLLESRNKIHFRSIWEDSSQNSSSSNIKFYNNSDSKFSFKVQERSNEVSRVSRKSNHKDTDHTITKQSQLIYLQPHLNKKISTTNINSNQHSNFYIPHDNRFFPLSVPTPLNKNSKFSFSSQKKLRQIPLRQNSESNFIKHSQSHCIKHIQTLQQTPIQKLNQVNNQYYAISPYAGSSNGLNSTPINILKKSFNSNSQKNSEFVFLKESFGK